MKLKRENKILSNSINFTIKTAQSEKKMIRTTGFLMDAKLLFSGFVHTCCNVHFKYFVFHDIISRCMSKARS